MSVRKAGLVTVGALATLFAASPLASAAELPSVPSLSELPAPSAVAPNPCSFTATGEDASESANLTEDLPGNVVTQIPVGGDNVGKCSTYGQHNDQGNGQNNVFTANGVSLPLPSFPGLPF